MNVLALAGGVGGAKLAYGLYHALRPGELTIVGNTGDDMEMFGVWISPDLDTVMYTLADLVNPWTGWGLKEDTHATLTMLERYGEFTWFQLGDRDFATHLLRSSRLRAGESLTQVTSELAKTLGINANLVPMCNEPISTKVISPEGKLDFQDYFVRRGASDDILGIHFEGADKAQLTPEVKLGIESADLIVICPSNPILSIWPILAVPGLKDLLNSVSAPIVAVSPIVGGKALKGPAAKVLTDLGYESTALGVAKIYAGLADCLVLDSVDEHLAFDVRKTGLQSFVTNTIMNTADDKIALARYIIDISRKL